MSSTIRSAAERVAHLHYRGWTLVDRGRFRFAVRDDNFKVMRRVCRDFEPQEDAMAKFRAVVDGEEDA